LLCQVIAATIFRQNKTPHCWGALLGGLESLYNPGDSLGGEFRE
jgi:hypothetical protein